MKSLPIDKNEAKQTLIEFLHFPLDDGYGILQKFAELPGAVYSAGENRIHRFVYVPGTKKKSVLLVAHVDTVWDKNYTWTHSGLPPKVEGDLISSQTPMTGIGADDRAGCALLWLLRNSGHGLLLVDGEEQGAFGSKHLRFQNPKLFREINRYAYILELDYSGKGLCHYHDVPNPTKFCKYIEKNFQCTPSTLRSRTDIVYLCKGACGVNLSIGVEHEHRPFETLRISYWLDTYEILCRVLAENQPKFRTKKFLRFCNFVKRKIRNLKRRIDKIRKAQ